MENWEQISDTDLLLEARARSEAFGVFYERHFSRRAEGRLRHQTLWDRA